MATFATHTQFKQVTNIGESLLMNELESNLKMFVDWGLLQVGGFFNVTIPTSGYYGGTFDKLRWTQDKSYIDGQVWQGIRKEWIWESGVTHSGGSPIQISGVYVNGILKTSGDSTYSYHIDYPLGRVIFDSAVPTGTTVQVEHSYRWCQVQQANLSPWWKELQYNTFRPDSIQWSTPPTSGEFNIMGQQRIQLPCILVECVPRRRNVGYELGNSALEAYQDVLFHVLSETLWERNQLLDVLSEQSSYNILLFNSNTIRASGAFPLDERGQVIYPAHNYPFLVDNYTWKTAFLNSTSIDETQTVHPRLHIGTVRTTIQVRMGDI